MKSNETRAALIAQAAARINAEFSRLNLAPLNSEQVDALGDESQAFEMLDDFEARLGCSDSEIAEARALLVDVFADTNPAEPKGRAAMKTPESTPARHTPGPWVWNADRYSLNTHTELAGHCVFTVLKWDGCTVERDCDIDAMWAEIEANKSLIAAAPELLAALQAVCDSGVMLAEPIERAMLDALKKAQGEQ